MFFRVLISPRHYKRPQDSQQPYSAIEVGKVSADGPLDD